MLKKKIFSLTYFIIILTIISIYIIKNDFIVVWANSAMLYYQEYGSYELVPISDDDISVLSEELIFDFRNNNNDYVSPAALVKAKYQMYNAGDTKTVKMGFPLIGNFNNDFDNYKVMIGDELIIPKIMVGKLASNLELSTLTFEEALENIYQPLDSFAGETIGYFYTVEGNRDFILNLKIDYRKSKLICDGYSLDYDNNIVKYKHSANSSKPLVFYILGEDISPTTDYGVITKEELTYNEFLERYIYDNDYLKNVDNYQELVINEFNSFLESTLPYKSVYEFVREYAHRLFLLVYDVTLEGKANSEVVVSYFMPGSYNARFKPPKFYYDYFTNPAKNWCSFNNLTVRIYLSDDSRYIIDSNLDFQQISDDEYYYFIDGLPENNITFTTCNDLNPARVRNNGIIIFFFVLFGILLIPILAGILLVIILYHRDYKKYQQMKEVKNG